MKEKIKLFIMSFWIFFLLLIIMTIDIPICLGVDSEFIGLKELFTINNCIAFSGIAFILLGKKAFNKFKR